MLSSIARSVYKEANRILSSKETLTTRDGGVLTCNVVPHDNKLRFLSDSSRVTDNGPAPVLLRYCAEDEKTSILMIS